MSDEKGLIQRHNSLIQGVKKDKFQTKQQFSQIYSDLCKNFKKEASKVKFSPIIDVSKYKQQQSTKIKKIINNVEKNDSFQKVQILNFPQSLPKVREATQQQKRKIKKGKLQAQKFLVNQTIYIHQKRRMQRCSKFQLFQTSPSSPFNTFHSILGQKSKKLKLSNLSRKIVIQNPQVQTNQRAKYCNTQINNKLLRLENEKTKIQFKKNKLIETILQVQDKKNLQNQQLKRIQLSQKQIFNYPLRQEKIIGNPKSLLLQTSFLIQKKNKWKSVQKVYSIKQKWKLQNSPLKRKSNWKITPFPLTKLQKTQVNKVFRRYLGLTNIQPPNLGFYKFYIGEGNNSQVIKQCLKSRGFWIQVDSLNDKPNFVWTQLPYQDFYAQESRIKQYQIKKPIKNYLEQSICQTVSKQSQIQNFLKYHQCDYIKACQKILSQQLFKNFIIQVIQKFKKGQKISYYSEMEKYVKQYMSQQRIKQFERLVPVKIKNQISNQQQQAFKATDLRFQNHVKNSHLIGNKKGLHKVFLQYCSKNNQNINDYVPPTIHFNFNDNISEQIMIFQVQTEIPQGPWLIKPGEDTNRGTGIIVAQSISSLISQIKYRKSQYEKKYQNDSKQNPQFSNNKSLPQKSVIVQKYIQPFLYHHRKFDIRVWVLWAKNQLWWYKQGYLRTSSKQFILTSTSRYVHLTNDAVQITNQDYGKYQPANKLSYSEFQKYLEHLNNSNNYRETNSSVMVIDHTGNTSNQKNKIDFQSIYRQMKQITKKLFTIIKDQLKENTLNFQLFGLDFVVGKDGKVWLIECNTNPSLEVHCSLQSRLIPNLIQNLMTIVVDPLFPCPQKKSKQSYNCFWNQQSFKFELLIDGNQEIQKNQSRK